MALPGHSPPPYATAGSPPRLLNVQPEPHFPPSIFGHPRPMLPPSPQNFGFSRYHPPPHTQMQMPGSLYDLKALPPQPPPPQPPTLQKRPGSSMSILSMLGDHPDRAAHETPPFHNHHPSRPGSVAAPPMSVSAMMSPPQQPVRAGIGEYPYKRPQTPDQMEHSLSVSRQRSASGPTRPLHEHDRYAKPPTPHFQSSLPFANLPISREEQGEGARRTSINALLQRPNSQPQSSIHLLQPSRTFDPLPPQRPAWYADPPPPVPEPPRTNGISFAYDTKPPGFREVPRTVPTTQPSPSLPQQSVSPEIRRSSTTNTFNRGFASLLNGPTSQPTDNGSATSHPMARQDSSQSQSDRSLLGDRGRFRHFSPFAGHAGAQHMPNGALDEAGRKGSDELSHKTIVGLSLENGRRYSPVPQAVQGAQAQTPVPDGGVKSERGTVFSGIGGGIGPSPTPVSGAKPASPFKKDDAANRTGESSSKPARTSSGIGKRSRKAQDDESRVDGEQSEARKQGSASKPNKRSKYQNSYKADLEEMATPSFQRRGTPAGSSLNRSATNAASSAGAANTAVRYDSAPIFKPKKTVKVATVMSQVVRKPRRHLGTFQYEPEILLPESAVTADQDPDICIKPKLLPSFPGSENLNCTYTIHVSKTWLQDRERKLICSTRNLWGSGIYTDDSDPLAAAMHMGWIKPSFHSNVDQTLLRRIVHDQNPKVDVAKEFKAPAQPIEPPKGRDLKITLVVMPPLERYEETTRFGIRSRAWPEISEHTPHDGVGYSVLKVEVLDVGPEERRLGRTGASRRARLKAQMEQRLRASRFEEERVARIMKRLQEKASLEKEKQEEEEKRRQHENQKVHGISGSPLANEIMMGSDEAPTTTAPAITADNEEWRRQLATAAA